MSSINTNYDQYLTASEMAAQSQARDFARLARMAIQKKQVDVAKEYIEKTKQAAQQEKNNYALIFALFLEASISQSFEQAESRLQAAIKLYQSSSINKPKFLGDLYTALGIGNQVTGKQEKSLEFYESALRIYEENDLVACEHNLATELLFLYNLEKKFKKAKILYCKYIKHVDLKTKVDFYTVFADIKMREGNHKKALNIAKRALSIAVENNFKSNIRELTIQIFNTYSSQYRKYLIGLTTIFGIVAYRRFSCRF